MRKILQVVECGGPGGTGEQVAAICNGLDPSRFEVTLVYAVREGSPEEYRAKCVGAKTAYFVPEMMREISLMNDLGAMRKLQKLFIELQPDIVHAHSSKAGALARAAAKAAGIKTVFYTPHGYGFLQQDRSAAMRFLYKTIEKAASHLGTTIACAPGEAVIAAALGGGLVHTICDAYLGNFSEPLPHDGLAVGSCGRLTYARNSDAWILLTQRLSDSRNGINCVWIGGGEDEPRIRTHIENMNLSGRVELTGWLTAEQARERMRALDLFVHYSRWDALPNAVLEAMAAGLPVVASDNTGNRDAIEDGVTGFIVKSEMELLERCQQLIDDTALRRKLGAAGRERVRRKFSRELMLENLSRLYAS